MHSRSRNPGNSRNPVRPFHSCLRQDGGNSLTPEERTALFADVGRVMAALHSVDFRAVGLEGYGKVGTTTHHGPAPHYTARQLKTWGRNFYTADGEVQNNDSSILKNTPG
jgi:aminoglycoside phosphotransferase (APT) family kinase protein